MQHVYSKKSFFYPSIKQKKVFLANSKKTDITLQLISIELKDLLNFLW